MLDQPSAPDPQPRFTPGPADNPLEQGASAAPGTQRRDASNTRRRSSGPAPTIATLTRLLVGSLPLEARIADALHIAIQLLPASTDLAVYAVEQGNTRLLLPLASVGRAVPRRPLRTLGSGEALDHQVLDLHHPARVADAVYQPLVLADQLLGVVTVTAGDTPAGAALEHQPEYTALTDVLTILLERRQRLAGEVRIQRALQFLPATLSSAEMPQASQPDQDEIAQPAERSSTAEMRLLQEVELLLRNLSGAATSTLLLMRHDGSLALASPRSESEREVRIAPEAAAHVIGAFTGRAPHAPRLGPAQSEMWQALEPALTALSLSLNAAIADVTLIPIYTEAHLAAIIVLAGAPPSAGWLALAQSIALSAGIALLLQRSDAALAERGRAYDAFISLAAHELRSPLTAVKGYAQLLLRQSRKIALPDLILRSAESIDQQAARMAEILDELHDAARIRRGVLEVAISRIDLAPLLLQSVERWREQDANHTFTLDLPEEPLIGDWDPRRITQMLRALLDNAARYSPHGSEVSVRAWREGQMALIAVRDQGLGIAPEDRERIFDYLYRAPATDARNLSGLGLGLFVSRSLAERLGGNLWLHTSDATEMPGSEFRIALPLTDE